MTNIITVTTQTCIDYLERYKNDTYTAIPAELQTGVDLLAAGEVVSFPTETVYGLAANALDPAAVAKIYAAKNRPSDNPLIVHVSSLEMVHSLVTEIPPIYGALIQKFWPGPLTLLMPKSDAVPIIITGTNVTVAVRLPGNFIARALITACGFPLAAPSANTSGRPSPTTAAHVYSDLCGRIPLILDGGACESGLESTVIDAFTNWKVPAILRPGGISLLQIRSVAGFENCRVWGKQSGDLTYDNTGTESMGPPQTPGMKYRHYSPDALVILIEYCASKQRQRGVVEEQIAKYSLMNLKVGLLHAETECKSAADFQYFLGDSAIEVAKNLFAGMRHLEALGSNVIVIEGISEDGTGLAVMNRATKAASCIQSIN